MSTTEQGDGQSPDSDDPEVRSPDVERHEESGPTTDETRIKDSESPGETIDDAEVAEPNEPA